MTRAAKSLGFEKTELLGARLIQLHSLTGERLKSRGCGERPHHHDTRDPQLPCISLLFCVFGLGHTSTAIVFDLTVPRHIGVIAANLERLAKKSNHSVSLSIWYTKVSL